LSKPCPSEILAIEYATRASTPARKTAMRLVSQIDVIALKTKMATISAVFKKPIKIL
jgi:hypothetical protein